MNKLIISIILTFSLYFCTNVSEKVLENIFISSSQQRASWKDIQDAEFEMGLPIKNDKIYYLSYSCNLNNGPNSFPMAISKSCVKVKNNEIIIYLYYKINMEMKNMDNIKLGKLNIGNYNVYYIDKNRSKYYIGEINIE
jgi:hypothetical protein